jgi:hypothetical protein
METVRSAMLSPVLVRTLLSIEHSTYHSVRYNLFCTLTAVFKPDGLVRSIKYAIEDSTYEYIKQNE